MPMALKNHVIVILFLDYIWLHVRSVGNWTNALYNYYKMEGISSIPSYKDSGRKTSLFPCDLTRRGKNIHFICNLYIDDTELTSVDTFRIVSHRSYLKTEMMQH